MVYVTELQGMINSLSMHVISVNFKAVPNKGGLVGSFDKINELPSRIKLVMSSLEASDSETLEPTDSL